MAKVDKVDNDIEVFRKPRSNVPTMILFDFSNLAHRCVHLDMIGAKTIDPKWGLWHYLVFTHMYEYVMAMSNISPGDEFDVVLALDAHDGYWRRDKYAPYKLDRQEKRAESGIDWQQAYKEFDVFIDRVRKYLPWKCISYSKCEADDVIYALSNEHADKGGDVFIYSSDSDYLMLLNNKINLWNPMRQEYAEFPYFCKVNGKPFFYDSPADYKKFAILTGQGGKDNVFNVKTPTDFSGTRKPGFGPAAAAKITDAPDFVSALKAEGLYDNYLRNEALIDPTKLPAEYYAGIADTYKSYAMPEVDVLAYLEAYRWRQPNPEAANMGIRTAAGIATPAAIFDEDIDGGDDANYESGESIGFSL